MIWLVWFHLGWDTIPEAMSLCAIAAVMAKIGMANQGNITTRKIRKEITGLTRTTEDIVSATKKDKENGK